MNPAPIISVFIALLVFLAGPLHAANTAPTPQIISATMRPGTTLMDVVYQVNDPDDATVRVRALAFVNGTRSFANVLRPVTFVNETAANLGDAVPSNTTKVLTWNVAADWDIDLGQVKFEILALDSRGLLGFDWITIPAANGQPALTISKDAPSDAAVLNALFWLYADNDPGLTLANGVLSGNAQSGVFEGIVLASGSTISNYGRPFCFKRMNLDFATANELAYANNTARTGILNSSNWHAVSRDWSGISIPLVWGRTVNSQAAIPLSVSLSMPLPYIAAGCNHCVVLQSSGSVAAWGGNSNGQINVPANLSGVVAVAASGRFNAANPDGYSLALKSDGSVVGWGSNSRGQTTIPADLSGVISIAAGEQHALALKSIGTVVGWGNNSNGESTIPAGLSGVTAIAAGMYHSLALKSNGTVVCWGASFSGRTTPPTGLSGVIAIAGGGSHSLALKSDGSVVAWGENASGQCTVPAGLTGVTAISAGVAYSLALKSDGSVVAWGENGSGQTTIPVGASGISAIAAGGYHVLALKAKAL
jgi:hypothetical protein